MNVNQCSMRKWRGRRKCDCILLFCEIVITVFVLYEVKMENQKIKKKNLGGRQIGNF